MICQQDIVVYFKMLLANLYYCTSITQIIDFIRNYDVFGFKQNTVTMQHNFLGESRNEQSILANVSASAN